MQDVLSESEIEVLFRLIRCHSTPGDESLPARVLWDAWRTAGLVCRGHGGHAISARAPGPTGRKPVLLVCAHLDSPGFAVERLEGNRLTLIRLGSARFDGPQAAGTLKTRSGLTEILIRKGTSAVGAEDDQSDDQRLFVHYEGVDARHGDRVCFRATPRLTGTRCVASPFLDNRLGCAALCRLARTAASHEPAFEVVLGATGSEELGGFGAAVLAQAVHPDLVLCLDATYEAPEQHVLLGAGPVLTLSDASVLLSPVVRDAILEWTADQGLRLQTEVYNTSGTDARAFPQAGLPAPVLPLLLATRGNHTPEETAALDDLAQLGALIEAFAHDPPRLPAGLTPT